jgi:ubiquitin-activating enzyme E1
MENFNTYFDHTIRDLLSIFPKDHLDKEGSPFWSGPKRCPSPITLDLNDSEHSTFVFTYSNLIALALGLKENRDQAAVMAMAAKT